MQNSDVGKVCNHFHRSKQITTTNHTGYSPAPILAIKIKPRFLLSGTNQALSTWQTFHFDCMLTKHVMSEDKNFNKNFMPVLHDMVLCNPLPQQRKLVFTFISVKTPARWMQILNIEKVTFSAERNRERKKVDRQVVSYLVSYWQNKSRLLF